MLTANQTVYYTSGPVVQEAVFIRYENKNCVLHTPMGMLIQRPGRVFSTEEAEERGLLLDTAAKKVREAFAV